MMRIKRYEQSTLTPIFALLKLSQPVVRRFSSEAEITTHLLRITADAEIGQIGALVRCAECNHLGDVRGSIGFEISARNQASHAVGNDNNFLMFRFLTYA